MPKYITSLERIGMQKGREQGLQEGLEQGVQQGLKAGLDFGIQQGMLFRSRDAIMEVLKARFVDVSYMFESTISKIDNLVLLKRLLRKAVTVSSLDEFQALPELHTYDATQR